MKHVQCISPEELSSMSTAVLRELLARELEADSAAHVNAELIMEITQILDSRSGHAPVDITSAYQDFTTSHLSGEMLYPAAESDRVPLRSRRFFRLGLVAATLVVLLTGITVTAQATSLWKIIASWTAETFQLDLGEPTDERTAALQETLREKDIYLSLAPHYLPEGYTLTQMDTGHGQIIAVYQKGDAALIIQVHSIASGNGSKLEKDDMEPVVYKVKGVQHYIVSNLGRYNATWVNEGYECTVTGIPSLEEAYQMIDSIYRGIPPIFDSFS